MHRHDLDLIAAYAEGSLDDVAVARALVESCSRCRAEFEAQSRAIHHLGSLDPVTLTDSERARLHETVWDGLQSAPPLPGRPALSWSRRLSYAAAALFLVVGLGAVLTNLGIGVGGQASDTTSLADLAFDEDASRAAGGDGEAAPATTGMAETTSTAAAEAAPLSADSYARSAEDIRGRLSQEEATEPESPPPGLERCLGDLGLDLVFVEVAEVDGATLWVVAPTSYDESSPLTFIDAAECRVVHVDG